MSSPLQNGASKYGKMIDYLRRTQAAEYLMSRFGAYTAETLAKLASVGGGPKFRKIGRFPVYTRDDLDAWANARMSPPVSSTAELCGHPSMYSNSEGAAK